MRHRERGHGRGGEEAGEPVADEGVRRAAWWRQPWWRQHGPVLSMLSVLIVTVTAVGLAGERSRDASPGSARPAGAAPHGNRRTADPDADADGGNDGTIREGDVGGGAARGDTANSPTAIMANVEPPRPDSPPAQDATGQSVPTPPAGRAAVTPPPPVPPPPGGRRARVVPQRAAPG